MPSTANTRDMICALTAKYRVLVEKIDRRDTIEYTRPGRLLLKTGGPVRDLFNKQHCMNVAGAKVLQEVILDKVV